MSLLNEIERHVKKPDHRSEMHEELEKWARENLDPLHEYGLRYVIYGTGMTLLNAYPNNKYWNYPHLELGSTSSQWFTLNFYKPPRWNDTDRYDAFILYTRKYTDKNGELIVPSEEFVDFNERELGEYLYHMLGERSVISNKEETI